MRKLLSRLLRLCGKPSSSSSRRMCLGVEHFEPRLLMDAAGLAMIQLATPELAPATAARVSGGVVGPRAVEVYDLSYPTEASRDQTMRLPLLDSKPDAPATLYLDFNGNFESDWWHDVDVPENHVSHVTTPVFDTDGDATSFNTAEQATIKEIWSQVAEDYAPFNINVSTDYYGSFNNGQALHVVIGGKNTDWLHEDASGISSIGSFTDGAPNVVFVFDLVAWAKAGVDDSEGHPLDGPAAMANTISHEAGHAFGLRHHSRYNFDGERINEYDPGTSGWTPIMGNNKASDRTTWDAGPTDQGWKTYQEDMAVIGGPANGFGFRADDHGDTTATADGLTWPNAVVAPLTGRGIINSRTDVDAFRFTTPGGRFEVRVDVARYGPNLLPVAELWSNNGFVARADAGGLTQSIIHADVPAGTYYVLVKGFGDYGGVGQYTVTVDFGRPLLTQASVATAPAAGLKLKAQLVKVKGQWQVWAFDAVGGKRQFLKTLPPSLSGRPEVSVADLNGDGNDDLLITGKAGKKKWRLRVSGLTGSPLPS
jgi:hypothetical protein